MLLISECRAFGELAIITYIYVAGLTRPSHKRDSSTGSRIERYTTELTRPVCIDASFIQHTLSSSNQTYRSLYCMWSSGTITPDIDCIHYIANMDNLYSTLESCKRGWRRFGEHCYGKFNIKMNWFDAQVRFYKILAADFTKFCFDYIMLI